MKKRVEVFPLTASTGLLIAKWYSTTQVVANRGRKQSIPGYLAVWKQYVAKATVLN